MNRLRYWLTITVLSGLTGLGACSTTDDEDTLYDQLGGESGVQRIADQLVRQIGGDPVIITYFADADVTRFRDMFARHLCAVSDGPCEWDGDSMQDIHAGMDIDERDFNRVVDLLIEAMNEAGVGHPVQNRVLARLAPLRADIIYR